MKLFICAAIVFASSIVHAEEIQVSSASQSHCQVDAYRASCILDSYSNGFVEIPGCSVTCTNGSKPVCQAGSKRLKSCDLGNVPSVCKCQ